MDVSKSKSNLNPASDLDVMDGMKKQLEENPKQPVEKGLDAVEPRTISASGEDSSELLVEVASLTGLPVDWVQSELAQIVKKSGHTPEQLTLDELRASMLEYLEEMNREMSAQETSDLEMLESLTVRSNHSH